MISSLTQKKPMTASSDGEHIAIMSGTPRSNFLPHFPNPFFIAIATP
jgi:hypothetical protein